MIASAFPVGVFADALEAVDRSITLDDAQEYECLGVRLYGAGAFLRETKSGLSIRRKKQSRVREGDVVYNKLFAWRGTFAVADATVDGAIASDKFPLYRVREDVVRPRYLEWWFRTDELANEARLLSKGAAALSKLTLNPPDFWKMPIPLPSLPEQDAVVSHLDASIARVEQLIALRAPIDAVIQGRRAGIGSELRLIMSAALGKLAEAYKDLSGVLDDVLVLRPRSGPSFPCSDEGTGTPVVMPSALGGYRLDESKCFYGDGTESVSEKDWVKRGDLLISRGNKRDQVGLCVVYDSDAERTYANLLMRMQVDRATTRPEFVKYWLMTPPAISHIRRNTKGTSPSVQKINQKALIATPFPTGIAIDVQERWCQYLDKMFHGAERLEGLARRQSEDAGIARKSILSAAFRGVCRDASRSVRI